MTSCFESNSNDPYSVETVQHQNEITNRINLSKEILMSISDGLFYLDNEWRFEYINKRAANNMGLEPDELLQLNIWDRFQHIKGTIIEKNLRHVMHERESVRFEMPGILKSRYYEYLVYPVLNGVLVYMIDITNRKKAEENLERTNRKINEILSSIQDDFYVLDHDWNFVYANKNLASKVHKEPKDFVGNNIWEMLPKLFGTVYEEKLQAAMEKREIQRFEIKGIYTSLYYRITVFPSEDGITILGTDITELKKVEDALNEKSQALEDAMRMKDEFLATITHELKTPLSVINAALQTIESVHGNQLNKNMNKHLQKIRINSFRQLRLVNNLLDITRYKTGHLTINERDMDIVYLSKVIVNSVDLYAKQKGVKLKFTSDTKRIEMAIDDEKYERILLNLLSNAIKFTQNKKTISIHISCKDKTVIIMVKDEGIGIPENKQELIFERFGQVNSSLTRQAEGTGIGLWLVKTLVEGMKGKITLESKINKGSTFTITLPITRLNQNNINDNIPDFIDGRIMQVTAIELSDIYLT